MKQALIPPYLIQNKSLSSLCTLGIGGPAKFYLEIKQIDAMQEAIRYCNSENIPFLVIGKGSNCLFDDRGFNGCILHNKIDFLNQTDNRFHVGAGYSFSRLGTHTAKLNFSGLEFASGIPASVGGAVFMNAGANGSETKDCLISVDFIDGEGNLHAYLREDLEFSYRQSSFQHMRGAIVGATFSLKENDEARAKQMEIIHYRKQTQPYSDKSAGCVFRNPTDVSAGKIIEECSLKGQGVGSARVSTLHANFLINQDTATAAEFKELISLVQHTVQLKTGTALECEIRMIPYEL
jgi:UDP-N-acetylmuramate dehydrogenase